MAIITLSNYNTKNDPFNEDMLEDGKEIYNEDQGSVIYHLITVQDYSTSRLSRYVGDMERREMKGGTIMKGWWWGSCSAGKLNIKRLYP